MSDSNSDDKDFEFGNLEKSGSDGSEDRTIF